MNEYNPDHGSPPGDTIADLLEERGMAIAQFLGKSGASPDAFFWVMTGDLAITEGTAWSLENVFGVPAAFWVERSLLYQNYLSSLSPCDRLKEMEESRQRFARFRPSLAIGQSSGDDHQELPFFS